MLGRYLFREIVVPLFAWTALLSVLFFVMAFLRGADFLLGSAVTPSDFGRFIAALLPQFLAQSLPIALLLAIVLGFGRLTEDGEILAMQAAGISPRRLFIAPLTVGVLVSLVVLLLSMTAQPWGMSTLRSIAQDMIRRNLVGEVRSGVFHEEVLNLTLYVESVDAQGKWKHVMLFDDRDHDTPLLVLAETGTVKLSESDAQMTFELKNGHLHRAARDSNEYSLLTFERGEFRADVGETFQQKNRFRSSLEEQTPIEMYASAQLERDNPKQFTKLMSFFHWRLGQLFMPIAFALIAAPLSLRRSKNSRAFGFGVTFAAYVAFYVLARVSMQLAETGALAPSIGGQLPNVVFLVAGAVLMLRAQRKGAV